MSDQRSVTVILSTFNRAKLLGPAIERLLNHAASSTPFELLVVDNNSTDETLKVVQQHMTAAGDRLRYVFEGQQGLSHARNAGIRAARADIVAFTDDDVRVTDDWVGVIKATFDRYPDVDCLGGRTLPVWPSPPPQWLTRQHWVGPLALQDYGDAPFIVEAQRALCLAGANFAFRKRVFERIGLFSPDFPRSQDTELMIRFWLSGARALYVPEMLAYAAVQPERLSKAYHRRWHFNVGRSNARMAFEERTTSSGGLCARLPGVQRVLGVPLFAVRQLGTQCAQWLRHLAGRRRAEAFWHEVQARAILGYMRESAAIYCCGTSPVPREDVCRVAEDEAAASGRVQ